MLRHLYAELAVQSYDALYHLIAEQNCITEQHVQHFDHFDITYTWKKVGVEVAPKVVKVVGQTILSRMRLNAEVCDPTTVAQGRVMTLLPTFDLLAPTTSLMSSFATKKFADSLYTELHDVTPSLESLRTCAEKVLKANNYTFLNAYFQYPAQNSLANAPRGTHVKRMKQTAAKALSLQVDFKDSRRLVLKKFLKHKGNLQGKNAWQTMKRSLQSGAGRRQGLRAPRAFSRTSRLEKEKSIFITGPGARKFINLFHAIPKLAGGIHDVSEAAIDFYSGFDYSVIEDNTRRTRF